VKVSEVIHAHGDLEAVGCFVRLREPGDTRIEEEMIQRQSHRNEFFPARGDSSERGEIAGERRQFAFE